MIQSPLEKVLAALSVHHCNPTKSGNGYKARCPAHDDRSPSLSLSPGDGGRALVNCHAGCQTEHVLAAIGLTLADLFTSKNGHTNNGFGGAAKPTGKAFTTVEDALVGVYTTDSIEG